MSEVLFLLLPIALATGLGLLLGRLLQRRRPGWPRRRIVGLAALPLPLLGSALGVAMFVWLEMTLPPGGCGMPLIGPIVLILLSGAAYMIAATACAALLPRRTR